MPGLDGFTVCERIRTRSSVPVIMLSARDREEDIVHALSIGADDYITKPFSPRTLVARIRALLRRAATADVTSIEAGGAKLDLERNELHVADIDVALTPLETRVLNALFRSAGRLVTTDRLATEAWGRAGAEERHALKQVVYRLRRKLEDTTSFHGLLETTRGAGYRWVGHGLSLRAETLHF
jgi:DNA-binding response OmpR family regulator